MNEYRICPMCNKKNSIEAPECNDCGADLSFVIPMILEKGKKEIESRPIGRATVAFTNFKLVHTGSGREIEIPIEGGIIGREADIGKELLYNNFYVSSHHAKIALREKGYIIIDEGSKNGTKLNGIKLEKGREYELTDGDSIVVANEQFSYGVV